MKYKIFNGFDHYNQRPLWCVTGTDNDFFGDWKSSKIDADNELAALLHYDGNLRDAESREEAIEALNDGLHVFRVHPMAEDEPELVNDAEQLENYGEGSILIECK